MTVDPDNLPADWRDDPRIAHLRDDAPYAVCSGCGRKSWAGKGAGATCGMPQPNGELCEGVFGLPIVPPPTPTRWTSR